MSSPEPQRRHERDGGNAPSPRRSTTASGSGPDGRRVRTRPLQGGGAEGPRLEPRGLGFDQQARRAEDDEQAITAEFGRILLAGHDAYKTLGLDRDSEPTDDAIADGLARLDELEDMLPFGFNEENELLIKRNIAHARANLSDEEAREAYDEALDDELDAAAAEAQTLEPFQVSIAAEVGFGRNADTGLLDVDLAQIAAASGEIKMVWSAEGGVGKTFAVSTHAPPWSPRHHMCVTVSSTQRV